MKAVVIEQYGGKDQLKEKDIPTPQINEDQVLIESHATSINPIDWKVREGYLKDMLDWDFPIILGWDVSGVVVDTGSNVTKFKKGDQVFARPATTPNGTYAEFVAVEEHLVTSIPERVSFEDAAATPLAALTSWQCLFEVANLQKGQKVLIHAGSGGVGTYAIQLAKWAGAYVASTASSKNKELLESLGVDRFINYEEEAFDEVLEDYDVVFDTLGGEIHDRSYNILKQGGHLVSVTKQPDEDFAKQKGVNAQFVFLNPDGDQLAKVAELMEKGEVKSIVGKTFPFSEKGIRDAHELSETHHARGKIVVQIKPTDC
ncbi:NADP-dependent oxidoreductase [Pontibacillus marinus]|uniref:NADPH:quinone reductase n=1 Tax=Pontibacillus marinus BH030004 = DSM 16465 TaxID=1385511 RepID=A0A0A5G577_9BACI|nr:NADP-dependent oxidoreductase [Pontibacillus marinus]KGX88281.1 NADPH:quinone reductase [Pontibacillus marinus BH030004 = DSM 16465]